MTLAELEAAGWVFVGVVDEGKGERGEWREILIRRVPGEVPGARVVVLEVGT